MASFSNQQLFFLLALLLPMAALGKENIYPTCGKNFTQNEILQRNINNTLLEMVGKTSIHRYAVSSFGVGYDIVYGVTRCQGDMDAVSCSECITSAAQSIRTSCPYSAESHIYYEDKCFLRYDTDKFIGKPDKRYARLSANAITPANPKAFEQAAGELLAEVMEATVGGSEKFGYGKNDVNAKETIYGMAQCTRDLDEHACNQCLENGVGIISKYCKHDVGCSFICRSCVIRYEIYQFLNFRYADDVVAAPALPPL